MGRLNFKLCLCFVVVRILLCGDVIINSVLRVVIVCVLVVSLSFEKFSLVLRFFNLLRFVVF